MRTSIVAILAAVLILSIAACQGEIGPPGPQGPAGAAGPAGPPGPAGESMAIDDAMIETLIAGMQEELEPIPPKWEPDEYTQYFVKEAIRRYDSEGLDATVDYYNSEESVDGQWYVFILDQDDIMLAHAVIPALVGRPASEAVAQNNYPAGEAIVSIADENGAWFSFEFPNPVSGIVEAKHSWSVKYDGLTFGSGWYERGIQKSDAPGYTRNFVARAIDLYDAIGREDTLAYYNSKESADGQWYIFIGGDDGRMAAHYDPQRVGLDVSTLTDPEGRLYGPDLMAATDSGNWVNYLRINPETGEFEQKHTWVVLHDGLIFGSGWYE